MFRGIVCTTAFLLLLVPSAATARNEAAKVQDRMAGAIETEAKAQVKADDWGLKKQDLVNEIRELQTRLVWLEYQTGKNEIYVQRMKETIADLEARKLEARQLRENLEPFLEEVVGRLEAFVAQDLPFLTPERQQRIYFLKNTMSDYHLDLGEKLRRVFEALAVEATYGRMVTASDETLNIDGADTIVSVFYLGRLAMFYQTLDGKRLGRWNPDSKHWEPISGDFSRQIRQALGMARRERSVELIQLPLGAVTP
jgi:hypothetical protein